MNSAGGPAPIGPSADAGNTRSRLLDRAQRHQRLLGQVAVIDLWIVGAAEVRILQLSHLLQTRDAASLDVRGRDMRPAPVRMLAVHELLAAGVIKTVRTVEGAIRLTLA